MPFLVYLLFWINPWLCCVLPNSPGSGSSHCSDCRIKYGINAESNIILYSDKQLTKLSTNWSSRQKPNLTWSCLFLLKQSGVGCIQGGVGSLGLGSCLGITVLCMDRFTFPIVQSCALQRILEFRNETECPCSGDAMFTYSCGILEFLMFF